MSQDKDNINKEPKPATGQPAQSAQADEAAAAQQIRAQDVFSTEVMLNSSEEELFVGDMSFLKELTSPAVQHTGRKPSLAASAGRLIYMILGANLLLMLVVVAVIWYQPIKVVNFKVSDSASSEQTNTVVRTQINKSESGPDEVSQPQVAAEPTAQLLDKAIEKAIFNPGDQTLITKGISIKTADDLFAAGRYLEAAYVYNRISQNWISSVSNGQYLKDYMKLRIGVCMHRAGESNAQEYCFTQALQSRSAYVRGIACYYLARIRFANQEYLEARQKAYQTIALCKSFEDMLLTNLEADMSFLAADSLTREVMQLYNMDSELPGNGWSDELLDIWPAQADALELEEILCRSAEKIGQGAANPKLTVDLNRPIGNQWSLVCLQSPLEETLWKIVTEANLKASWAGDSQSIKDYPVAAYMMFVPQQYMAETICGSAGLIWRFDGQIASIANPKNYTDFETHRTLLVGETVSMWQRFLIRYRNDGRIANLHYALGRMYTFSGQYAAALGEFKLLQGRFSDSVLAPYAYLEGGKIKVDTKDYEGARHDLNEMLLVYPDCPIVDEATLYLAKTTLEAGHIQQAREMFGKSFEMNISRSGKFEAAVGLGRCAYLQKDWNGAQSKLLEALDLIEEKDNYSFGDIYFMLGRCYIELGQYAAANKMLHAALNTKLSEKEYIQAVLELVDAECGQKNYVDALEILGRVPPARLGQEDSCALLIARARVLREIGVTESAISLLRKRIEFVADSQLRARLTLELAVCYMAAEDYSLARNELNSVLPSMPEGDAARATLVLAQIIEKMGQPERAESLCIRMLSELQAEPKLRDEAFNLLGRIYTTQKYYDKAALAFAGILPQGAARP